MKIRKEHLERAERAGTLPPGGADTLWCDLSLQMAEEPSFKLQHLLYYFGAMLMVLPLTLFVSSGFLEIGDAGLLAIAVLVGSGSFLVAEKLLSLGRRIAAGTFSVVALSMVPLAVYSLLTLLGADLSSAPYPSNYAGFHQHISPHYVIVELCTLAVSVFFLYRHRLPFQMLPVSVVLWYLGMDLSSRLAGDTYSNAWHTWSIFYGLVLLAGAYAVDQRTRHTLADYSFWLWLFGTLTFWGALSLSDSNNELAKVGYAFINVALIFGSVIVRRRVLAVFGALGLLGYLGHLCLTVFKDTAVFPFVTLLAGAGIVWLGLRWPCLEARIGKALGLQPAPPTA